MTNNFTRFETGAIRNSEEDFPRYDLLSPIALEKLAKVAALGAKKYGEANWLKGIPIRNLINHAINHLFKFLRRDDSEDHLAHSLWNIHAAIHIMHYRPDLDDRIFSEAESKESS